MLTTTFIAVAILMAISAFFSGSETALTAVSRGRMHQLEKDGSMAAANVNRLVANRERIWKDSRSVRNAKIGDPYECLSNDGTTCFCIEANARNSLGGYTGASLSQAKFDSPTSVRMIDAMYAPEKCGRMVPFPEMNGAQ